MPSSNCALLSNQLRDSGYCLLDESLDQTLVDRIISDCDDSFQNENQGKLASSRMGNVYAARNLIHHVPIVKTFWQKGFIRKFLNKHLGTVFGLVRVLYFDKPPNQTWALPWHKDTAIAVKSNQGESKQLTRPTIKAGTPHMIASDGILNEMLTLRVHLDEVTLENGPLKVIPGSHHSSKSEGIGISGAEIIQANRGSVLAMRPLLTHSSGSSAPETQMHRRILHLEFSKTKDLPDSFQWHDFIEPADSTSL